MEALNFLRLWINSYGVHKLNQTQPCNGSGGGDATITAEAFDHELDEGDDAFIDLQFRLHEVEDKGNVGNKVLGLSPNDHFSKRKILPVEPISKPQSPIALLKSTQKFRVFTPKKPKPVTPKHEKQGGSKHFAGEDSLRKTNGKTDDSSARLPKDLVRKYLNVIKPLYTKISKKNSHRISGDFSLLSPTASPANTRGIYKHLGKSKSSSAAASPINRRDDSLLLQDDGIQSAILHCKRSFNSSRAESSWLSRCTSDSSAQEKLSNASSTDSSLFSRATSSSARTSSEGHVFST